VLKPNKQLSIGRDAPQQNEMAALRQSKLMLVCSKNKEIVDERDGGVVREDFVPSVGLFEILFF
jgi:hypothetical protein